MQLRSLFKTGTKNAGLAAALFSTVFNPLLPISLNAESPKKTVSSPIQHVIIILGENRSFDHIFATYVPKHGGTVSNLLSKGIVTTDGKPGPNYWLSNQYSASNTTTYSLNPGSKALYANIPPVVAGGPKTPYFSTVAQAKLIEPLCAVEQPSYRRSVRRIPL
ncbi:MAG: hypothetical protein DMG96_05115 [Acidobacteria bacterium]|nr:MAG: hypothetical protein DMG98_08750 [Acidobacteriota bacterium]PYV79153.1 MAG: hypothetical protein DMG96_05115 [Acidobacteriota bacterium]